jgi:branched-chain amino acid transport system substrate-binding protein
MILAAHEIGLEPKLFGGGMVGLHFTSLLTKLGPKLNGIVDYGFWVPEPTMKFPGVDDFLKKYQPAAVKAGVDPLGFYLPPWAYAMMQVLGAAIEGTKGLDQGKLADYIHATEFNTIVGKVKFGPDGEWAKHRTVAMQFQNIKGNDAEQFRQAGKQVVIWPDEFKSGKLIYPYSAARK